MINHINTYLKTNASEVVSFWQGDTTFSWTPKRLQDHADYIYTKTLLGEHGWHTRVSATNFIQILKSQPFAGTSSSKDTLLPHLSAYLLGSVNLLAESYPDLREELLSSLNLDINTLIDSRSSLPIWPKRWSHHTWRVSHWIGGIPSLLLTFARHDPRKRINEQGVSNILSAIEDKLLDTTTGRLKAYKNELLQFAFKNLYRLRHNPEHGEIGGVVHILWVEYAMNRPYIGASELLNSCYDALSTPRFLESTPYCLDFDYVQLARTSLSQLGISPDAIFAKRVRKYSEDVSVFLASFDHSNFTLHKIPGALATIHEAEMILGNKRISSLDAGVIDIINTAYWL